MNTAKNKVFVRLYHEKCYLLGVNWPLVGGKKFDREGGVSLLEGIFQVGGMSKFAAAGAYSITHMHKPDMCW